MLRIFLPIIALQIAVFGASLPASAQNPLQQTGTSQDAASTDASKAIDSLLSVIQDDASRKEFVKKLEALKEGSPPSADQAPAEPDSIARQVADFTTSGVQSAYQNVTSAWRDLTGISAIFRGLSDAKRTRIEDNALQLLGTILVTVVLLQILTRIFARLVHPRRFPRSRHRSVRILVSVGCNLVSDLLAVALSYAGGYFVAITFFGSGSLAVEQSLYVNAFLIAGVVRIVIRLFVRDDRPDHAILNLSAPAQRSAQRWLVTISGILIYGLTFVIPVANLWTTFLVGRSLRVMVTTLAAILAIIAIHRIASRINADSIPDKPEEAEGDEVAQSPSADPPATHSQLPFWHRAWPVIAYVYVVVSYVVAIGYPNLMAEIIGAATVKTVLAAAVLAFGIRILQSAARSRLRLPRWMTRVLPSFDDKLNVLTPYIVRAIAIAMIIAALVYMIDAWQLVDIEGWLGRDHVMAYGGRLLSALIVAVAVVLVWAVVTAWIDTRLSLDLPGRNVTARTRTLLSLFKNAVTVVAVVFGLMMTLSELGIDIAPLLAGAGVIGLAIGFGAQKLVQDIITGIFIQLENAINEGDVVTVAGTTGVVEKLTIRSVGVRDLDGIYHIVPFSAVDTVSNYMRLFSYHVAVIGVAYKERVPLVKEAMVEAFQRLKGTEHGSTILEDLEMHGVVALADSSVNIRARIKTLPGSQWAVGRAYTEFVKEVFDERGIEIPFPHRTIVYPPAEPMEPEAQKADGVLENSSLDDTVPPGDEDSL